MKPNHILLFISWCIFFVVCFPAAADSQFGFKPGEFASQKHWPREHSTDYSFGISKTSHKESNHSESNTSSHRSGNRSESNSRKWGQQRSDQTRSKPYRTSNESDHRSPDKDSSDGNEQRRSPRPRGETPSPRQEHKEQRPDNRPDHRHNDHGHQPPRGQDRRPDKQPDKPRPDNRHKEPPPDKRHNDHRHDKQHDHRGEDRHTPYSPPRHDHRHYPRPYYEPHYKSHYKPKYRLHNRHKYIYYRTPWYNTWFLAPILWHYHGIGFTLEILPSPYVRIVVGGIPYFYAYGTFYRPYDRGYIVVSAPIGAVVATLPAGYIAFSMGLDTYYFVNHTYYVWDEPRDGFVVVPKPEGAERAMQQATQGRLYVYPNEGQSDELQAKDRYACHLWAVSESGVDPTLEEQDYTNSEKSAYKRAITACLEGRGYTVK